MANARSDVLLVIKAKDEAERVVTSATEALRHLLGVQGDLGDNAPLTGGKLRALAGAVQAVETAYSKIDNAAGRADSAFARQRGSLDATRAKLAQVRAAIENEGRTIAEAQRLIVDTHLAGGDTAPLIASIKQAEGAVKSLEREEVKLTRSIGAQEAAIGQSRNSLQQLGSIANAAEAALVGVGDEARRAGIKTAASADEAVAGYRAQGRAIQDLINLEQRVGIGGAPATSQGASFEALDEQARAMEAIAAGAREVGLAETEMAAAAQRLRDRTDPLAAIQRRLNGELDRARTLYRAGKISAKELADAEAHLANEANQASEALNRQGRGEHGRPSLFGLKPYELTNLGYQINDIFTQLASGTSLTQTLAQQGGQLLQLFKNLGSHIVSALTNPVILSFAAGMGLVVLGIARARAEAERIRGFEGFLTTLGDGARYSARELAGTVRELRKLGVSAEHAGAAVRTLVRGGINPNFIGDFAETSRDMVDALPEQFENAAEASRALSEAFSGNFDDLEKLQQATGTFTAEEMRQIRTMFEQGQQAQGLSRAFDILRERMGEGADEARGPWRDATRSLSRGWDSVLTKLSDTRPIQGAMRAIEDLGEALTTLGDLMSGDFANPGIRLRERILSETRDALQTARERGDSPDGIARIEAQIAQMEQRLRQERGQSSGAPGSGTAAGSGSNAGGAGNIRDPNSQAAQQRRDAIDREMEQSVIQLRLDRHLNEAQRIGNRQLAIRLAGEREYQRVLTQTTNASRAAAARIVAERAESNRLDVEAEERARRGGQLTTFAHPLRGAGRTTSGFGNRTDPIDGRQRFHSGIDYAAPTGTPVYATGDGRVTRSGPRNNGYGISVEIDFGNNVEDLFGHLSRTVVQAGQQVRQGDLIGYVGSTGRSTGPHLHHRRQVGGRSVDPTLNTTAETNAADAAAEPAQEGMNRSLEEEGRLREMNVRQARELVGLAGEALFDTMRRHTVERAVATAEQQAQRQGLALSQAQRAEIERTVAAEYDVANARERATRMVDELGGEREALIERLRDAYRTGDNQAVADLAVQLQRVDTALESAIARSMEFWRTQGNTPDARAAMTRLATLRDGLDQARIEVTREHIDRLRSLRESLIEGINRAFEQGDLATFSRLDGQLASVETALNDAGRALEDFWRRKGDSPEARAGLLDMANLRSEIERTNAAIYEHRVDTLGEQRRGLLQRLETLQEMGGDGAATARIREDVADVDRQLLQAIESADNFWSRFTDSPETSQKRSAFAQLRDEIRSAAEEMRRAPAERSLEQTRSRRDSLQQQMEFLRDQGAMGAANLLREEIRAADAEILRTTDHLIAMWQVSLRPDAPAAIARLQVMRNEVAQAGREFAITAGEIQGAFAGSLTTAALGFGEAIGSGRNAVLALWDTARTFAADFLRQIAEMLLKQEALKAAMSVGFGGVAGRLNSMLDVAPIATAATGLTAAGGTLTSAGATLGTASGTLTAAGALWERVSAQLTAAAATLFAANSVGVGGGGGGLAALAAGVFHDGGIAGAGSRMRSAPPAWFANAARFHGGGVIGLGAREIPAILERGEEVLRRDDPRHILNGVGVGGSSAIPAETTVNLKNVNVFDAADVLEKGLSSRVGQKVLLNYVRANNRAFKSAIDG
jgi:murein DD-endopeptidase MepM/ murein hydrolase activator NlpD